MKVLGFLVSVLWAVSAWWLLKRGLLLAEVIVIGVLVAVALLLTYKREDLAQEQRICFFGGLIICAVLAFSKAVKGSSFNDVTSLVAAAGVLSLPLILSSPAGSVLSRFWGESRVPFPSMGGRVEDFGVGCVIFVMLWAIRLFFACALGFLFTVLLFFWSLEELISNASLSFAGTAGAPGPPAGLEEQCEAQHRSAVPAEENRAEPPAASGHRSPPAPESNAAPNAEKTTENDGGNKTVHWL